MVERMGIHPGKRKSQDLHRVVGLNLELVLLIRLTAPWPQHAAKVCCPPRER